MTNENCLDGLRCPRCGNEDRLYIVTTVLADVTDNGADVARGSEWQWDDASMTRCPDCDRDGPLNEFRTPPQLPPDPEGMNFDRAAWADKAIAAFRRETGTDREDALPDLLCDLMHWSDRAGYRFDAALNRARDHYAAETAAEAA
ncbi:MAG: hypothetical protein C0501_31620 [Isosphaera sp.]|nr:hypothetical protein [Isosphaera sp.]